MFRKKIYGSSQKSSCPFCGKQSLTKNEQNIPVCLTHKKAMLGDMKCSCGDWLDLKEGKYGAFFTCMNCGCISMSKALAINPEATKVPVPETKTKSLSSFPSKTKSFSSFAKKPGSKPKEITVTSDELDFL